MIKAEVFRVIFLKGSDFMKSRIRAGLIIETMESAGNMPRIKQTVEKKNACTVTTVTIDNDEDAKKLNKEKGTYITVETERVYEITDGDFETIVDALAAAIRSLMPEKRGRVLVAGIGSRAVTADSLGPKCVDRIIVTRGFEKVMPQAIEKGDFSGVSAICPNVFGVTGVESAELINGVCAMIEPSLVIAVDAMATTSLTRLCKTVQLSNTSLIPGGGLDNARRAISPHGVDARLLSIGMPTVIEAKDFLKGAGVERDLDEPMIVTPARIDSATDAAAKLIAFSINRALHRNMTTDDILRFLY